MFKAAGILRNLMMVCLGVVLVTATATGADKKPQPQLKAEVGDNDTSGFVTEKRKDGTTIKYKKKATYDFEGTNVEGLYNKPSGSYISNIKDVKAKTIMRIRKNFDAEVIDSARMVK
jgi:hypothetical protein